MTTPIRPSLAQLLATNQQTQAQSASARASTAAKPAAPVTAAQRSLFSQIMGQSQAVQPQTIAPPTYRAEEIQRATTVPATNIDQGQKILRPGSYINIRV